MGQVPSIKGTVIRALVEDVRAALRDGVITREVAERILEPADFDVLQSEISDIFWYDIRSYRRLSELLRNQFAKGDRQYIQKRGGAAAERLIALGVYQQVDFLQRIGRSETAAIAYQNLKLTATLWNSFFNFGSWTTERDDATGDFSMVVSDSDDMPAIAWDAIEGFIARLTAEVDRDGVQLERTKDARGNVRFVFHIQRTSLLPRT